MQTHSAPLVSMKDESENPDSLSRILSCEEGAVWVQIGTLLDGVSSMPRNNAHIVYNAESIEYVGRADDPPPANLLKPGQQSPDCILPSHTIMPGLVEAHAHLFLEGGELDLQKRQAYLKQSPAELLSLAKERLEKLVRLGIMTVRDAGDKDGVGLGLAKLYLNAHQSINPGIHQSTNPPIRRPLMPYLDSPGAAIHHKSRYGSFMADPIENYPSLRTCVEARISAGAHRIKLIPTGIINFKQGAVTTAPQMTVEEVAEIVRVAKSFGKQTFAHASGADGIEIAIEGGVDSVEHGFFIRDDQLAEMRDRQIAWVPTFAPVQAQVDHAAEMGWDDSIKSNLQRILDQHAAILRKAHELGVLIIAGSDAGSCGVAHGYGLLCELELMEKAGLPSMAVINAATGTPSSRLGFHQKIGQIKPGYKTRVIFTEHSPLQSVSNLQRSRTAVFDKAVYGYPQDPLKGL
jgi:imidazolonepropionase-like amidohydrolase